MGSRNDPVSGAFVAMRADMAMAMGEQRTRRTRREAIKPKVTTKGRACNAQLGVAQA